MPVISSDRTLKRITLSRYPQSDPAWIEFYERASTGDVEAAFEGNPKNDITQVLQIIASLVKNWNFTNAEGQPEPITVETLRRMDPDDIKEIREAIEATMELTPLSAQKKTGSSATSKQS